jgi:hypothetical protein
MAAPSSLQPRPTASDRLLRLLRVADPMDAAVFLVAALILFTWAWGIFHRGWDYDEVEHAHVSWLVRRGFRPFADFFEAHPPFLWYPLAGLTWLWGDRYSLLFAFRMLTAVGHLLFLAAIAKNLRLSFARLSTPAPLSWRVLVLCGALVVGHPYIINYLVDFRLDAWPNALLLFAVYWYRRGTPTDRRSLLFAAGRFGFLATAAVIFSPKVATFLAVFVIVSVAGTAGRGWRLLGMAAGAVTALAAAALILLIAQINLVQFFKVVYPYHHLLNSKGGFEHGMIDGVMMMKPLALIGGLSALACLMVLRRRILSSPFEVAVLGYSAVQLAMVSFAFRQYYAPWFLLTAALFPYLELLLRRVRTLHAAAAALALIYGASNAIDSHRAYEPTNDASAEIWFRESMEALVPKDGLVMSPGEIMPIFRRSPLFHSITSFAPSGYGTEAIMQELGMGAKFTEEFYRRELDRKRPHLVIYNGALTDAQRRAVESHLQAFASDYRVMETVRGPVYVRQR